MADSPCRAHTARQPFFPDITVALCSNDGQRCVCGALRRHRIQHFRHIIHFAKAKKRFNTNIPRNVRAAATRTHEPTHTYGHHRFWLKNSKNVSHISRKIRPMVFGIVIHMDGFAAQKGRKMAKFASEFSPGIARTVNIYFIHKLLCYHTAVLSLMCEGARVHSRKRSLRWTFSKLLIRFLR